MGIKKALLRIRLVSTVALTVACAVAIAQQQGLYTDSVYFAGHTYRTVKIGTQTWMAENLKHIKNNCSCYNEDKKYCEKYGRLYEWAAAMNACPAGWHLPSRDEWNSLMEAVGGVRDSSSSRYYRYAAAGEKLKSKTGWDDSGGISGNGTDDYGFSALPGGVRYNPHRSARQNNSANWWSATAYNRYRSYYWRMHPNGDGAGDGVDDQDSGYSVRCVKD